MLAKLQGKCCLSEAIINIGDEIVRIEGKGWALKSAARNYRPETPKCSLCTDAELTGDRVWKGICIPCRNQLLNVGDEGWTVETVRLALQHDNEYLERAIVRLYERQTSDEQGAKQTRHLNSIGFNSPDAPKLSKNAQWIKAGNHLDGKFLADARTRMMKYAKQVAEIANDSRLAKDIVASDKHRGADRDGTGEPVDNTLEVRRRPLQVAQKPLPVPGTIVVNLSNTKTW